MRVWLATAAGGGAPPLILGIGHSLMEQVQQPRDREIRSHLLRSIERPLASRIVEEMGVLSGEIRVDVALVSTTLEGFEIKSDHDSLIRLPRQTAAYCRVFDRLTLVASKTHLSKALDIVPEWWGLWAIEVGSETFDFRQIRPAELNPSVDLAAVVQLLWKDEAVALLRKWCTATGVAKWTRRKLWHQVLESVPASEIKRAVTFILTQRSGWREPAKAASTCLETKVR